MKSTCVQPVHLTLEFLPFTGRKSLNTTHTCRAALLNRERLFCCRDSGLSACSLTGEVRNSDCVWMTAKKNLYAEHERAGLSSQPARRMCIATNYRRTTPPVSLHHSKNKSQLQSGFKFGVPSLRVAGYNTLETSLVRSGAYRGASNVRGQKTSRCGFNSIAMPFRSPKGERRKGGRGIGGERKLQHDTQNLNFNNMTEEYSEYLNSDAWKLRRNKRLAIAKFRCAACGAGKSVQVHHLTYERIFNEEMSDLLPLCDSHHKTAESLVKSGHLNRRGDVLFLATETVRLILEKQSYHFPKPASKPLKIIHQSPKNFGARKIITRNPEQVELSKQQWFVEAMKLPREVFKMEVIKNLVGNARFLRYSANCFAIYDRDARKSSRSKKLENRNFFKDLITSKGGFKKSTLESLGESWPPIKGWKKRILARNSENGAIK